MSLLFLYNYKIKLRLLVVFDVVIVYKVIKKIVWI